MKGYSINSANKSIFVTVRSGSRRLPQKCYLTINGVPNIVRLINRLKKSSEANIIVLCTTTLAEDDKLAGIASDNGIFFYRGPVEDKLERWKQAAKSTNTEFFVTADGDDLLCDVELIDMALRQYNRTKADFIKAEGLIPGSFTYGIKTEALNKVCDIKGTTDTEMMSQYFTNIKEYTADLFCVEDLQNVPDIFKRPEIRMTLDYSEDFRFFKTIIEALDKTNKNFTLRDVVYYLDENPEVIQINQFLQEKFLANQKARTKLVLKY